MPKVDRKHKLALLTGAGLVLAAIFCLCCPWQSLQDIKVEVQCLSWALRTLDLLGAGDEVFTIGSNLIVDLNTAAESFSSHMLGGRPVFLHPVPEGLLPPLDQWDFHWEGGTALTEFRGAYFVSLSFSDNTKVLFQVDPEVYRLRDLLFR